MAKPPHVDRDRIDDAFVTALAAMEQPVNLDRIVKATETMKEALAEMKYFCAPDNAPNLGRLEALDYALTTDFFLKGTLLAWGSACGFLCILSLVALPWQQGIPQAMEMLGAFGLMPALLGGSMLVSAFMERGTRRFVAYHVRCAPILLATGTGLMAFGLLGASLGS